jgi:hypothetical protein
MSHENDLSAELRRPKPVYRGSRRNGLLFVVFQKAGLNEAIATKLVTVK